MKPSAALVGASGAQDWGLWALLAGCGACGQVRILTTALPLPARPCLSSRTAGTAVSIAAWRRRSSNRLWACSASMAVGGHRLAHGLTTGPRSSTSAARNPLQPAQSLHCCLFRTTKPALCCLLTHADLGAAHHFRRTPLCPAALDDGWPAAGYSRCVAHRQPSLWNHFHPPDALGSSPVPPRVRSAPVSSRADTLGGCSTILPGMAGGAPAMLLQPPDLQVVVSPKVSRLSQVPGCLHMIPRF